MAIKDLRKNDPEKYRNQIRHFYERRPFYAWAQGTIRHHKDNGIKIEINVKELEELAINTKYCPLCGCELKRNNGIGPNNTSPTLDRVNGEKVIKKDNIMIMCHKCNATKRDRSLSEFIQYCEHIVSLKNAILIRINQSAAE